MWQFFILTLFVFQSLSSGEDESELAKTATDSKDDSYFDTLANLEAIPSSQVGPVNVITGHYCEVETDLVFNACERFTYERSRSGSNEYRRNPGWNSNHYGHFFDDRKPSGKHSRFEYDGDHGEKLKIETVKNKKYIHKEAINPSEFEQGVTNCSNTICGQSNLKNMFLCSNYEQDPGHLVLQMPDGTKRHFLNKEADENINNNNHNYYLKKEEKPSGNYFAITREKIDLHNRIGEKIGSITETILDKDQRHLVTSDGQWVNYKINHLFCKSAAGPVHDDHALITKVTKSDGSTIDYQYVLDKTISKTFLISKNFPNNRFIKLNYWGTKKGKRNNPELKIDLSSTDPLNGTIRSIATPCGRDSNPVDQYQYWYFKDHKKNHKSAGHTFVFDALDRMKRYNHFDRRLSSIQYYNADKSKIYKTEFLDWIEDTDLKTHSLHDENSQKVYQKNYTYDENHNPIKETIEGNLRGKGYESYIKTKTFTQDGTNRLLSEKDFNQATYYTYEGDSNLISSKIMIGFDGIKVRTFYEYNKYGVCSKEIIDDGVSNDKNDLSGVTERRITCTYCNQRGLPERVEHKVRDSDGLEKQIRLETVHYDHLGRADNKQIFGLNGELELNFDYQYNARGQVIYEKDPLGRVILRLYDENGNLTRENSPKYKVDTIFTYDFMNRLIRKEETDGDISYFEHYQYDLCGNKTSEIDALGNEIRHEYDFLNRLTKSTFPLVKNDNGSVAASTFSKSYDVFDHPVISTDSVGYQTKKLFTLLGKPYLITHPNGCAERMEYDFNGQLVKTISQNGVKTEFTLDSLGRVTSTRMISPSGELLSQTSSTYSTFHKLSDTDSLGFTTQYEYNSLGQKTNETNGNYTVHFAYDSLGRLSHTITPDIVSIQIFDACNQIIEERVESHQGEILSQTKYVYDELGHKILVSCLTESGLSISENRYNRYGKLLWSKDPIGNVSAVEYDYQYINELGQRVLKETGTDPKGNQMVKIHDALSRVVSTEIRDPFGNIISRKELTYDLLNNKRFVKEYVYKDSKIIKTLLTEWWYDSDHHVTTLTEAKGSQEQKKTYFEYNSLGQKEKVLKQNGITLEHHYDLLGRLSDLKSSDGSIYYTYHYDLLNRITAIYDKIHNTSTLREYDDNGNLSFEKLGNDLSLSFEYDSSGHLTKVTYPDFSSSHYTYHAGRLQNITRNQFTTRYSSYTPQSTPLKIELASGASLEFAYNLKGQETKRSSPTYTQETTYDCLGNILTCLANNVTTSYQYDPQNQLTSEKGRSNHIYNHDSAHNCHTQDNDQATFNHLNQLTSFKGITYTYEPHGNLIQKGNTFYTYDALDRLIAVESPTSKLSYTYDSFNRRLTKNTPDSSQLFIYQLDNEIGSALPSGEITELRILGLGKGAEIGAAVLLELSSQTYIPLHDHNGNLIQLLSPTHNLIEEYTFSSFGLLENPTPLSPWLFSSKRLDPDLSYYYFGNRYYDPDTHRWTTCDPSGFDSSPNLYAYVHNNPLTHFDLYGLYSISDFSQSDFTSKWGSVVPQHGINPINNYHGKNLLGLRSDCLAGKGMGQLLNSWSGDKSEIYHQRGKPLPPGLLISSANGINTSLDEIKARAQSISNKIGGYELAAIVNGTAGICGDAFECIINKSKMFVTPPEVAMYNLFVNFIDSNGGPNSDCKILHSAHSQGGLLTYNVLKMLPKEYARKIHVSTFGSPKQIPEKFAGSAVNYVNIFDKISLIFDPLGILLGVCNLGTNTQVNIIPQNKYSISGWLFDHSFEDSYSDQFKNFTYDSQMAIKEYENKYSDSNYK